MFRKSYQIQTLKRKVNWRISKHDSYRLFNDEQAMKANWQRADFG